VEGWKDGDWKDEGKAFLSTSTRVRGKGKGAEGTSVSRETLVFAIR
jgi:hypothetical protein